MFLNKKLSDVSTQLAVQTPSQLANQGNSLLVLALAITYNIHSQSRADSSDRRPMTDTSEQCVVESQDLVQETVSHCLFASLPA